MEALETFAVDDRRARFLVFLLGNPHLLEGGERGQDGAADPHRVLTLGGSDDLEEEKRGGGGGDVEGWLRTQRLRFFAAQCTSVAYLNQSCGYTELAILVKMQFSMLL